MVNEFLQGQTQKSWVEKAWCLYLHCSLPKADNASSSAGLTIVANVAIATGPALLGAPRSFMLKLFLIICKGGY